MSSNGTSWLANACNDSSRTRSSSSYSSRLTIEVAEGVPSNEDLAHLEAIGVELAQANLLCPAIPLKQLLASDFFCDPAFGTPLPQETAEQTLPSGVESRVESGVESRVHNSVQTSVQSIDREHAFAKAAAASQSFYT